MKDTRPAYRGGGYGFPKIQGAYGSGRRRVYWEREGGLISERAGQVSGRRISEGVQVIPTFVSGVITGAGIGLGIMLLGKLVKAR